MLELIRVLVAFVLVYIAVPLIAGRRKDASEPAVDAAVRAVLLTSLFFQFTIFGLGWLKLALPLPVMLAYAAWIMALRRSADGSRSLSGGNYGQSLADQTLSSLNPRRWVGVSLSRLHSWTPSRISPLAGYVVLLLAVSLFERAAFSLQNLHFAGVEGYSRSISLHALNAGDVWQPDSSVAVLSPIVLVSGLSPETVVRFSEPVFAILSIVAVGACVLRLSGHLWAACIACALVAAAPLVSAGTAPASARADMASVYLILAFAAVLTSPLTAVAGVILALLLNPPSFEPLAIPIVCVVTAVTAGKILERVRCGFRHFAAGFCSVICSTLLLAHSGEGAIDGPLQYEAAARACRKIAGQFPRNSWLVVSTTYERPFTYKRGWHVEILDFVSKHSVQQVGRPDFRFAYEVRDLFLFVEKQPVLPQICPTCWQWSLGVSQTFDPAALAYVSPRGRASLQFNAAKLIAAYQRTHRDLSVFYSDDHLTVYHVRLHG